MIIRTTELTGLALNWAMAKGMGESIALGVDIRTAVRDYQGRWDITGPLLEPWEVELYRVDGQCAAAIKFAKAVNVPAGFKVQSSTFRAYRAETYLVAACRCIVAQQMGDEVDVPEQFAIA